METTENLYCLICLIVSSSIISFILSSIYIAFTIIGLVNTSYNEIYKLCKNSHLWIYNLVSLILFLVSMKNVHNSLQNQNNNYKQIIIQAIILLIISFWGAFEIFFVNCVNELDNTILYRTSFMYWLINTIMLFLLLLGVTIKLFNFTNNLKIQNSTEENNKLIDPFLS
jgi:hypothetical protein